LSEPTDAPPPKDKGFIARTWAFISRPSKRFALGTLVVAGAILGVLFWGAFNWAMELANTESFCISCHEMRANPYAELQNTIHFKNRSGVRATCPDCHVHQPQHCLIEVAPVASAELLPREPKLPTRGYCGAPNGQA
jgi:cytochrome c-type protein NapC